MPEPNATRTQIVFAGPWIWRLWHGFVFVAITFAALQGVGAASLIRHPLAALWLVLIVVICLPLNLLVAGVVGAIMLGPVFRRRGRMNGGPFQVGEEVLILTGPFKGRITRVYSMWQGATFRLDLGDEAKQKFKDIFVDWQVLRVHPPSPSGERAMTSAAVVLITRLGDAIPNPTEADLRSALEELDQHDLEHVSSSLQVSSGWSLNVFQSSLVVWESVNSSDPMEARRMIGVSRQRAMDLWNLLAAGDFIGLENQPWLPGHG